jgi:hypothetical protein
MPTFGFRIRGDLQTKTKLDCLLNFHSGAHNKLGIFPELSNFGNHPSKAGVTTHLICYQPIATSSVFGFEQPMSLE